MGLCLFILGMVRLFVNCEKLSQNLISHTILDGLGLGIGMSWVWAQTHTCPICDFCYFSQNHFKIYNLQCTQFYTSSRILLHAIGFSVPYIVSYMILYGRGYNRRLARPLLGGVDFTRKWASGCTVKLKT